jgi:hypothetical protein
MEKLMKRWSDPARPNLLPKPGKVGEYSELRSMPDFGKYNIPVLIDAADTYGVHTCARYAVECDAHLWGVDSERAKLLVSQVVDKISS